MGQPPLAQRPARPSIIGVLLLLSSILLASTLFPTVNIVALTIGLFTMIVIVSAATFLVLHIVRRTSAAPDTAAIRRVDRSERDTWRTPPLRALKPYVWTPSLRMGMIMLRGYLILSAVLLVIKAIQLSLRLTGVRTWPSCRLSRLPSGDPSTY